MEVVDLRSKGAHKTEAAEAMDLESLEGYSTTSVVVLVVDLLQYLVDLRMAERSTRGQMGHMMPRGGTPGHMTNPCLS